MISKTRHVVRMLQSFGLLSLALIFLALCQTGCLEMSQSARMTIVPSRPLPAQAGRVTVFIQLNAGKGGEAWLKLASVALVGEAAVVPLATGDKPLVAADIGTGQQFLARGPVAAGHYRYLRLSLENAALLRGKEKLILTLQQPVVDLRLPGTFQVEAGSSRTLIVSWDDTASLQTTSVFSAQMTVSSPQLPLLADLAYVSCPDIDTLYLINTNNNRVSGSLAISGAPSSMAYAEDRKRLYILAAGESAIYVVEVATSRIVDKFKIPMTVSPTYFMSPDGRRGYILDEGSNSLLRMDLAQGAMTNRVRLGYQPRHLIWHEASQQLVLSSALFQKIYFLDPDSLATKDTLLVGSSPDGLLADASNLYVAEQGANNVGIFDLDSRQAIKRVNVGFRPRRLLKRNNNLYVANFGSNTISLLLLQQQRVARSIQVGHGPLEMAASDRSKWLYVAAQKSGVVSVVDQTANRLNTTIELGAMPADIVVVD